MTFSRRRFVQGIAGCTSLVIAPKDGFRRTDALFQRIKGQAPAHLAKLKAGGGYAVSVVNGGRFAFSAAFGRADLGTRRLFAATTPINVASVSKPVATWLILRFLQERRLTPDAKVFDFVKDFRLDEGPPITFAEVLSHTAGLSMPSEPIIPADQPIPSLLDILRGGDGQQGLKRVPETIGRWSYSGGGFLLAQKAVEDATSEPFHALARRQLFESLHMDRSDFRFSSAIRRGAAVGIESGEAVAPYHLAGAAGGLFTSVNDLAHLLTLYAPRNAPTRREYLSDALFEIMLKPVAPVQLEGVDTTGALYGLGHGIFEAENGEKLAHHSGGNPGVAAYFITSLKSGDGMAMVTNNREEGIAVLTALRDFWGESEGTRLPPLY